MIAVKLTRGFYVHGCDDLDAHTDRVMDELLALESATVADADVTAVLADEIVEISVTAYANDFDGAIELADGTIRAAIHAADGHTPEWTPVTMAAEKSLVPA